MLIFNSSVYQCLTITYVSVVLKKLLGNLGSAYALMMNPEELIKPNSPFGLFLRHMIISFEMASFEQLSMFLQVRILKIKLEKLKSKRDFSLMPEFARKYSLIVDFIMEIENFICLLLLWTTPYEF